MKESIFDLVTTEDDDLSMLNFHSIEHKLSKLRQSKNVSVAQLKEIYDLGVTFYNCFQFKEAEIIFSAYVSLNPYDHRGPGCLAAIYLEKGQFRKALDILEVLKSYPTNDLDETVINMALCHYKLNEHLHAASMLLIVRVSNLNDFYQKRYNYLLQQLQPYM